LKKVIQELIQQSIFSKTLVVIKWKIVVLNNLTWQFLELDEITLQ
jgi:hypothetical protein